MRNYNHPLRAPVSYTHLDVYKRQRIVRNYYRFHLMITVKREIITESDIITKKINFYEKKERRKNVNPFEHYC